MDRTKVFLTIQTVICVLVVLMLSFGAIGVYKEGKAGKEADPSAHIYTKEEAVSAAACGMMTAFLGLGISVACWIMGIKDENADKPVSFARISKDPVTGRVCKPLDENKKKAIPPDKLKIIRLAVLALAVIFIIAGIANGNMYAIMIKAINICTECVGLG